MDTNDLTHRIHAYTRGRQVALALGAAPLLALYLAIHTPWLKPALQDRTHLVVALLIVLPLAWLLALAHGWRRIGPRLLRLDCPACGQRLVDPAPPPSGSDLRCALCDARVIQRNG